MGSESDGPAPGERLVDWVFSSTSAEQVAARYDYWSSSYEDDLERDYGYSAPQLTIPVVQRRVPKSSRILDAGAGTGLVGQLLAGAGYEDMLGIDISTAMLAEARKKGVYRELRQMVLGEPLDFETDSFDAVVSVGVLNPSHVPASTLNEFVRVTKAGGHVIFTQITGVREDGGFGAKQLELETAGLWKLVEVTDEAPPMEKALPETMTRVWAFEVIG